MKDKAKQMNNLLDRPTPPISNANATTTSSLHENSSTVPQTSYQTPPATTVLPQPSWHNALLQRPTANVLPQMSSHNTLPQRPTANVLPQTSYHNVLPQTSYRKRPTTIPYHNAL